MKTEQKWKIGDCVELMKEIPEESIDMVITSPPYDNIRMYDGCVFDFESTSQQLLRVMKKGGVIVWIVSDATINGSETCTSFKQALYFKEIGFNLHDTMIYQKLNYTPLNHNRYEPTFEFMFILSKGKPKTFNPITLPCKHAGVIRKRNSRYENHARRGRHVTEITKENKIKGNIWGYNVGTNLTTKDRFAFKHPAMFPEELVRDHILSWSNEGDLVLDPFLGSGTTLKICMETNRNGIGFEVNERYESIIRERLKLNR